MHVAFVANLEAVQVSSLAVKIARPLQAIQSGSKTDRQLLGCVRHTNERKALEPNTVLTLCSLCGVGTGGAWAPSCTRPCWMSSSP